MDKNNRLPQIEAPGARTIAMPEGLVQAILDNLKTQPYEQVFQLISQIMQTCQSQNKDAAATDVSA